MSPELCVYAVSGDSDNSHLGGNLFEGDPWTYCPKTWTYVIDRFAIKSVLDLGSGFGYSSHFFKNKGLDVLAVDGLEQNINRAVYPTFLHDITKGPIKTRVDLVHCHELVEHVEEKYLDNLLASMACGKFVMMTNAPPGQGGYHHVNEQPTEYWIEHMKRYGYEVLPEDSMRIKAIANSEGAVWMGQTGTIYINRAF